MPLSRRATLLAALASPALAQPPWPDRPIRFLQGFGGGGTTDIVARLMAPGLAQALGQPVVVENRPGAGGTLAAEALARATDNHTIMLINNGFAVSAALYRRLPFDPLVEIAPIAMVAATGLLLLVPADGPRDMAGFLAGARARRDPWNVATVGVGSTQHFVAEALQAEGDFRLTHVPYRGTPAAITALRAGEVQAVVETASAVLGQVLSGDMRALAITSPVRSPLLPEVPTVAEALQKPFELETWFALAVPARMPEVASTRLAVALRALLADEMLRARLLSLGLVPRQPGTPQATRAAVHAEIARWAAVIERTGMERQ
jgi:tripartite-type tricarboxylate transporter receptor subunit TctC